jgi:putative acetyltransferase
MIRKYKASELSELLMIWEAAALLAHPFLNSDFHHKVKKAMREVFLPQSNTWVYETNEGLAGFISMHNNEIGGLFVHPSKHGKGIGSALVGHMKQFFETLEVEVFEKNAIGKPFYERNGFEQTHEYTHEDTGEKVLRMRKVLISGMDRVEGLTACVSMVMNGSKEALWSALVSPDVAKKYFYGATVSSDWVPGSSITWEGEYNGNKYHEKGTLLVVKPNERLQYTHWSNLENLADLPENYRLWTFDISAATQGGVKLTITEAGIPTEKQQQRSITFWQGVLELIKNYIEHDH